MPYAHRKGEHGAAILETFLAMVLLGMILFGILQIFQLALADLVTDYAAFRGARSAAVGFKEQYVRREVFVKAAPVAGHLLEPDQQGYPDWNRTETEKALLEDYMNARPRRIEYAYWNKGDVNYHTSYYCPHYGQTLSSGETCDICSYDMEPPERADQKNNWLTSTFQLFSPKQKTRRKTYIGTSLNPGKSDVSFSMTFHNYPLDIPLHDLITGQEYIDISGDASLTNHSSAFLE